MHFPISCWCQIVDRLESFVEAALFFVSALEGDGLDGVVGFDQALRGALEALADDVGVDGGVDQLVEAELQFFAVELAAEALDAVLRVEVIIEKLPDLFNQLDVSSFHEAKSIRLVDRSGFGESTRIRESTALIARVEMPRQD
jgi:hypothetical protein